MVLEFCLTQKQINFGFWFRSPFIIASEIENIFSTIPKTTPGPENQQKIYVRA
jgi:hypothetical protein